LETFISGGREPIAPVADGSAQTTTLAEARHALRRKAKSTHPDAGGDAGAFSEVMDAFEALRPNLPRCRVAPSPTPYDWTLGAACEGHIWEEKRPPRRQVRQPDVDFASVLVRTLAAMDGAAA
jgi:hypothetical protein